MFVYFKLAVFFLNWSRMNWVISTNECINMSWIFIQSSTTWRVLHTGINVPRSRFLPVKTTSDLLIIMSNLYSLRHGSLEMNPKRWRWLWWWLWWWWWVLWYSLLLLFCLTVFLIIFFVWVININKDFLNYVFPFTNLTIVLIKIFFVKYYFHSETS